MDGKKTWMELSHYRWKFSIYRWNLPIIDRNVLFRDGIFPFKHLEKHLETMDFPLKHVS